MANSADRSPLASRARRSRTLAHRRRLALESLEDRRLLTSMNYTLFDTGVDGQGNPLNTGSTGAADTHYTVTVPGSDATQTPTTTSSNASGWNSAAGKSQWIAPTADQSNGDSNSAVGTYTYETTVQVPTAGSGFIQGMIAADDEVAISINNVPTGFSQSGQMDVMKPFQEFANFHAGSNTIEFIVKNDAVGPTGLRVDSLILNLAPTVTADNATVTVPYGGSLTATGTFADSDPKDSVAITSSRTAGQVTQSGTQSGTYTLNESNVTKGGPVTITATDSQGNITTTTFNLVVTPPSLTAGGGTGTTVAGSSGTVVDSKITVNDPDGPNLTTAAVSIGTNFTPGEDRLLFTDQGGITGSYSSSTGILTLSGSATPAAYQTALRSVRYQDTNTNPNTVNTAPRTINFSIAPGAYNPSNGHFYQFVSNPGISWSAAKTAADASSLYGLQGYLATLTSAAENTFAFSKTQSTGWIGASDANSPGVWKWVDGPEAGQQFWQGKADGSPVNGMYNDWNKGEPNDDNNVEFYAQYLDTGLWNDLSNTASVNGYLIEYGGMQGDPTLQLTSQATMNVQYVTGAPTVTSPSAPVVTNQPTVTVSGTAAAGSLVQIYNDANHDGMIDNGEVVVGNEQLQATQTAYTISLPIAANALTTFLVTSTQAGEMESTPTAVPAVTSDTIAPVVPVITSPTKPSTTNATSAAISGTAEANSLIQVYRDTNGDGKVDEGDVLVGFDQLSGGATSFVIDATLAANTGNSLLVTATDAASNMSTAAVVPTITQDSIAPAIPTGANPSQPVVTQAATFTLTGRAEAGSLVQIYNDADGSGTVSTGDTVIGSLQLGASQTSYSIAVPLASNTINRLLVTATDAATNQSAALVVPTITTDTIAPAVPMLMTPKAPVATTAASFMLSGSAESGSLIQVYSDTNGDGVVDDGDTLAGAFQMTGSQSVFSMNMTLAPNAVNKFLVTATDAAGNVSKALVVPTITTDTIAPLVPVLANPTTPVDTAAATVKITGTAEAGSLVSLYNDANGNGKVDAGDTLISSVQLGSEVSTFLFQPTLTKNALNHFLVTATDAVGNISNPLVVPTVTSDTIAPVAPTTTTATSITTTKLTTTVSGTAEAGSLVLIYRDANANGQIDASDPVVGQLQLAANQTAYSIAVPLGAGTANHFLITATDGAGNQSSPTALPTITQSAPIQGTVFLDLNNDGIRGTSESALAGRVVYLDLNGSGTFVTGDPTATADNNGHFVFADAPAGSAVVRDLPMKNTALHYSVSTATIGADGSVSLAVTPFSALMPMPVLGGSAISPTATDSTTRFVQSLYQSVLGRTGTDAEVAAWMSKLSSGTTQGQVAAGFVNSIEHRTDQVAAYYSEFLHRATDPGAATWVDKLLAGASEQSVAQGILSSPEYQNSHTGADNLVAGLYNDVFGRQASSAEVAAWDSALANGLTTSDLVDRFVNSTEADDQAVQALYTFALGRQREAVSSDYWTDQLAKDATVSEVAIGILGSNEYQSKVTRGLKTTGSGSGN